MPGTAVTRTVVVRSARLPRKTFRIFIELEDMYRNMVEQLTMHAVRNDVKSFVKLRALKYRELRSLYPRLPSHYAYTACQDAATRAKSFLKLRRLGQTERAYPEVRSVSIWLDNDLWRPSGMTSVKVSTHKGRLTIWLEPTRHYWRYVNRGWKLASEARVKLDRRGRRLVFYFTFKKEINEYEPRGHVSVDVNEDNVTALIDGIAYLFETDVKEITLGYHYRIKSVQERYDKTYGPGSRPARRALRRLKYRRRKDDVRWKLANIIVRAAYERRYAIVMEHLGRRPAEGMISHIKDPQLRFRIFQAAFRGVQRAIEEKAREHGVPVVYVDPRNTSRLCPIHNAPIEYDGSRVGRCSKGGEAWHRDVAAVWNLLLRAMRGDGSNAPSPALALASVDGRAVPLPSTGPHEPTGIPRALWARAKSPRLTMTEYKVIGVRA
mgnify:CR=1 FL=1